MERPGASLRTKEIVAGLKSRKSASVLRLTRFGMFGDLVGRGIIAQSKPCQCNAGLNFRALDTSSNCYSKYVQDECWSYTRCNHKGGPWMYCHRSTAGRYKSLDAKYAKEEPQASRRLPWRPLRLSSAPVVSKLFACPPRICREIRCSCPALRPRPLAHSLSDSICFSSRVACTAYVI